MPAKMPWWRYLSETEIKAIIRGKGRRTESAHGTLARPGCIKDTYRVTKKKIQYRKHEGKLLPESDCVCATSRDCPCTPQDERTVGPWLHLQNLSIQSDGLFQGIPPLSYLWFCAETFDSKLIDTQIRNPPQQFIEVAADFARLSNELMNNRDCYATTHKALRRWLSKMRTYSTSRDLLKQSHLLAETSNFLRWLNDNNVSYSRVPQDLEVDLIWLSGKWEKGDWNLSDPLRGINVADRGISRRLNKSWQWYNPNHSQFGHNGLVVGETWPYQITVLRDGGHGFTEAGISGVKGMGATSVVLSNPDLRNEYADWDEGEVIGYVSTWGEPDSPTASTQLLLDSYDSCVSNYEVKAEKTAVEKDEKSQTFNNVTTAKVDDRILKVEEGDAMLTKNLKEDSEKKESKGDDKCGGMNQGPRSKIQDDIGYPAIRVFRTSRLPPHNKWRPNQGYRYDGLYIIMEKEVLDKEHEIYRFKMVRVPGQPCISVDQPDARGCLLAYQCAAAQKAGADKS